MQSLRALTISPIIFVRSSSFMAATSFAMGTDWHIGVAQGHGPLHIDGEVNGVYDAAKLHQGAVAHELDDAPVMLSGLGLDQFSAKCFERRERSCLVGSHEAAVTDNVGSEDGGQPALYACFAHGKPLAGEIAV
jgi:hypothetical protein